MDVSTRTIADVAVVDLKGRMTLGEGTRLFHEHLQRLLSEGETRIVLNCRELSYIDSSGLGEIVGAYTAVRRRGGTLVLAALAKKIEDLLMLEKLLTVFVVADTIEEAVAAFSWRGVEASCPACRTWVAFRGPDSRAQCRDCLTAFELTARTAALETTLANQDSTVESTVSWFSMPTYQGEYVHVTLGSPCTVTVHGRLDKFAAEVVEKAWGVLPKPRRVLFTLTWLNRDFTSVGVATVVGLCRSSDGSRAAISEGWNMAPDLRRAVDGEWGSPDWASAQSDVHDRTPPDVSVTVRRSAFGPAR
jgi:anti-sigma B factor antagonist